MSQTIDQAVEAVTTEALERYGTLPEGWQLRYMYQDSPYLVTLDCWDCNATVGRWQVGQEQIGSFGPEVFRSAEQHAHWLRLTAGRRRIEVVGEDSACILTSVLAYRTADGRTYHPDDITIVRDVPEEQR